MSENPVLSNWVSIPFFHYILSVLTRLLIIKTSNLDPNFEPSHIEPLRRHQFWQCQMWQCAGRPRRCKSCWPPDGNCKRSSLGCLYVWISMRKFLHIFYIYLHTCILSFLIPWAYPRKCSTKIFFSLREQSQNFRAIERKSHFSKVRISDYQVNMIQNSSLKSTWNLINSDVKNEILAWNQLWSSHSSPRPQKWLLQRMALGKSSQKQEPLRGHGWWLHRSFSLATPSQKRSGDFVP